MSRDTVCRSEYSDMSKRRNATPSTRAICLASSVLPTPVGPEKRNDPTGFSGGRSPERASLIVATALEIAASCPKITACSSRSSPASCVLSSAETLLGGILAMRATMFSIACAPTSGGGAGGGAAASRACAPASSITSMALSGRCRSLMCLPASSAAACSPSSV
jgi:hypothetical protein